MDKMLYYDNVNDLLILVGDNLDFITTETKRIVDQMGKMDDPNYYVLVSQNITYSLIMCLLEQLHIRNETFIREMVRKQNFNEERKI